MQHLLQDAADILQEIGSNDLGRCEEQACLATAVARCPNTENGRALCGKHCGPEDVTTQGYRWSHLWSLEDISFIAQELGIALEDLSLLETWWRPIPMQAVMQGLVVGNGKGKPVFVDLDYQADIEGRTALVWSENFGDMLYARWVFSAQGIHKEENVMELEQEQKDAER